MLIILTHSDCQMTCFWHDLLSKVPITVGIFSGPADGLRVATDFSNVSTLHSAMAVSLM